MAESLLAVNDLSVAFGGVQAVANVSLHVERGDRIGVIGPNGAGKTTLLNAISGIVTRTGSITFNGRSLDHLPPHKLAWLGVGRTFQLAEHFHDFAVLDYLMLGEIPRVRPSIVRAALGWPQIFRHEQQIRARAQALLDELGLGVWGPQKLSETPYGIQKLADICRATLSEPTLLLLDEPTSGTAASERELIASTFELLAKRGLTIVLVDHDSEFVGRVTNRMVLMDLGRVIAEGSPAEVLNSEAARSAYLGTRASRT